MKKINNRLDERQELLLLNLEHRGFWFTFFGLLISVFVQEFALGYDFRAFAGELIILLPISIYLIIGCISNGIWDRYLKPDTKTNTLISAIAAGIFGAAAAYGSCRKYPGKAPIRYMATGIFSAVFIFALCMLVLSVTAAAYRKRRESLEKPDEDEMCL